MALGPGLCEMVGEADFGGMRCASDPVYDCFTERLRVHFDWEPLRKVNAVEYGGLMGNLEKFGELKVDCGT